jgi:hypothetical protein
LQQGERQSQEKERFHWGSLQRSAERQSGRALNCGTKS